MKKGGEAHKMKKDFLDQEIFQYALTHGIINENELSRSVEDMKRKQIISSHPYSIWQNEAGLWCTHIRDINGKKKIRRRKTKEELLDFIVHHYRELEEKIYIKDLFEEWSEKKLRYGEISKQSYDKYCSEFKRFFTPDKKICKKQVKQITELDLEDFIKSTIHDMSLTRKAYSNLSLLINGIFKYAKKKKLTQISITHFMGDMELSRNTFIKRYKPKELEVFSEEEIPLVTDYLKAHPDIWNLALLLQFETGLRIGELTALKHADIYPEHILISRTERKVKNEEGKWIVDVQDYPKTFAGFREVLLSPSALKTIRKIKMANPFGEYLFMNNGKRIRGNTINKRLHTVCENLGINYRSTHKIRKTYGTTLIDGNVDESLIAEQMGHVDISTTKQYYYYSNKSKKNKLKQISQAINY